MRRLKTCEMNMIEHSAYLGLGSNLGDRLATLRQARLALQATTGIRVIATSSPLPDGTGRWPT